MSKYTQWYIYTKGNQTVNQRVSEKLDGHGFDEAVPLATGGTLAMWQCPNYSFVTEFRNFAQSAGFKVTFYVRNCPNGKARVCSFLEDRFKTVSRETRKSMRAFLDAHGKKSVEV